jgi:hypothetical protein
MTLSLTTNKILHGSIVALFVVAGLGPFVASMTGVLPAEWLADASRVVAVAAGLTLYMSASPLLAPWLPTKTPATLVQAAVARAVDEGAPIDGTAKLPKPPKLPPVVGLMLGAMLLSGCAWFKANAPTVESDLSQDGLCVLAQAVTGEASAMSIATECGIPTISQVVALVGKLIAAYSPTFDAGSGVVGARALTPAEVVLLGRLKSIK